MKDAKPRKPTLGVMLHVTPQDEQTPTQTYAEFGRLVREIETLGYQQAWVTEHHFTPHSLTPAPLLMMGHFLAQTTRLQLGAAAILLGFHNPIEVAEQLATLNTLYPQRVLCGFAKGGPFESQNAAFKADAELSRARMEEAVPAVLELINHPDSNHLGKHYQWGTLELHPRTHIPEERFFMATSHPSSLEIAIEHNLGLMAAQFWDQAKIEANIAAYRRLHPQGKTPQMMAARGLFIADSEEKAQTLAWQHIQSFRAQKTQLWGQKGTNHRGPMQGLSKEELLERMLCGTMEQVSQQVQSLIDIGVSQLGLNPLTSDHDTRLQQLQCFKNAIWDPLLKNRYEDAA
ncbi:LLM class flavin-dependent oxidoreductase [Thiomicrorhabdus sp.]|uniref:LLM class flavin-dependent oxidoreductase n=1 Tax=Thiomicrorhabdus sp. TaxID=2039724 RepID=UPI0029C8D5F1|nr:LLM class flavin-dependent oxidoreductase [Thiomicrorhabdus sp.]